MTRTIACALLVGVLAGCNKAKPTTGPVPSAQPGPPAPAAPSSPVKPDYLAHTLKPRATAKSGIRPEQGSPVRLFLSGDGARLALSSSDVNKTQVWDLRGEPKKLNEFAGAARALSPDGKLYVRSGDGKTEVVNADTGAVVSPLKVEDQSVMEFHFRTPAALTGARLADLEPGKPRELIVREFNTADGTQTTSVRVPYDEPLSRFHLGVNGGDELVTGSPKSKRVRFWNVTTGKLVRECKLPDDDKVSTFTTFLPSPDGKWLMTEASSGTAVFDAKTGAAVCPLPPGAILGRFVPRTDLIAAKVIFGDKKYQMQQGYSVSRIPSRETRAFLPSDGLQIGFSDDGKVAVTLTEAGDLKVWDLSQLPAGGG